MKNNEKWVSCSYTWLTIFENSDKQSGLKIVRLPQTPDVFANSSEAGTAAITLASSQSEGSAVLQSCM